MIKTKFKTRSQGVRVIARKCLLASMMLGSMLLGASAFAQTVTLTNISGFKVFAGGGGYSGSYTNVQIRAVLTGDFTTVLNPVTLSVSGAPAGLTTVFLTNNFTGSQTLFLNFGVTNVAKGVYPLTFSATTNGQPIGNTLVIPLIVGTLWTNSNPAGDVTWANSANWSGGVPATGDDVMFQDAGYNTNTLGGSVSLNSLSFIRNLSGTNQNMAIAAGQTVQVLGTNGFAVNVDSFPGNNKTTTVNIFGAGGTLLVSNTAANFTVNGVSTSGTGTTLGMANLDTLKAYVSRFCSGDFTTALQGLVGNGGTSPQGTRLDLAKTNIIYATYVGDYTTTNPILTAISYENHYDGNNGGTAPLNLGLNTTIQADAMIFGQGKSGGSSSAVQINSSFVNLRPSASFRNTNNGRITLLGVAIDSGTTTNTGNNSRMILNLNNVNVDMLVDTIWLGRNRLFSSSPNTLNRGNLLFDWGTINANTIRAGYQAYTGEGLCQADITVGGNSTNTALLVVNTELNLGYTAGDWGAGNAVRNFGRLTIATNGTARVNQVTVGTLSTNNTITIQNGGVLVLSNAVASPVKGLTTLAMTGGSLTLSAVAGTTNIFVTNLTTTVGSKININSLSGFVSYPATNVIIKYDIASDHSSLGIGALPPGFNNLLLNDNTANKTIELIISTNAPQSLVWKGPGSIWDHSSYNWVLATNTSIAAKFTDGDKVIFNDTAGVPTAITISEIVAPSQTGIGISFTNSVNNYVFTSTSPNGISAGSLNKYGTGSVQMDAFANVTAQINAGKLFGSGVLASVVTANSTFFGWSGQVMGSSSIGGGATNSGTLSSVTVSAGGSLTNNGTISGTFTVNTNALLYNNGTIANLGTSTVDSGGRMVNAAGSITGFSISVSGVFEDAGISPIKLSATASGGQPAGLDIKGGGLFVPGGSGIGTTTVLQTSDNDPLASGNVKFNPGSTNIIKVDPGAAGQKNTKVLSNIQFLGGSHGLPLVADGGTVVMTNVGATPFAAGQSFKLFGTQPSDGSFNPDIFPLNTTNALPIMVPAHPAFGLDWDLSQVIYDGTVTIVASALPQTPTNIVLSTSGNTMTLSWPTEYTGWRLLSQTNTLSIGLSTNWAIVGGSTTNNSVTITNNPANPSVYYKLSYPYP